MTHVLLLFGIWDTVIVLPTYLVTYLVTYLLIYLPYHPAL